MREACSFWLKEPREDVPGMTARQRCACEGSEHQVLHLGRVPPIAGGVSDRPPPGRCAGVCRRR